MRGRAQELPSFHSHTQYTNTSALRDPLKRWNYRLRADGVPQQATKPPLLGLAVLPTSALEDEDQEDQNLHQNMQSTRTTSVSRFSLVQYAFTGAIYAQDMELRTKREVESADGNIPKDAIISADYTRNSDTDAASGNHLSSKIARHLTENGVQDDQMLETLIEAANANVASWKHELKEAQEQADEAIVEVAELVPHMDLDLKRLLNVLRLSLLEDRTGNEGDADIQAMLASAMEYIRESTFPLTM